MDKYDKLNIVGRGSFGTVYLCRSKATGQEVIVKQIHGVQLSREEQQATLNEARVLAMLNHPNIIQYYDSFIEEHSLMIVMECAAGGTLFNYLEERKGNLLPEQQVLHLFSQILLAIHHVHSHKVLHRDLKTENILLNRHHDIVKIGDFGISKVLNTKSKAITVIGTPCYLSPELCDSKPYNEKSDVWAMGCVLYELITLRRAFEEETLAQLVKTIMAAEYKPLTGRCSTALQQLVYSMLHLDPVKRPSTAELMANYLLLNSLCKIYATLGRVRPTAGNGADGDQE